MAVSAMPNTEGWVRHLVIDSALQGLEAGNGQVLADEGDSLLNSDGQSEAGPSESMGPAHNGDLLGSIASNGTNAHQRLLQANQRCNSESWVASIAYLLQETWRLVSWVARLWDRNRNVT